MQINNRKRAVRLKQVFFIISAVFTVASLIFFIINLTALALISIGIFSLWYIYFHVADYQFIEYSDENNKVRLRFYKAISFGNPNFNEIEFLHPVLKDALFENSVFGKMSDLTLFVKTKRGVAEYPSVSLSALCKADRQKMADSINNIISKIK